MIKLIYFSFLICKTWLYAGLLDQASAGDLTMIAVLAGFCAIHNHGFETLFSFSVIVQHTPRPPFGFSILKAGLSKSVILSVYTSSSRANQFDSSSHGMSLSCIIYVLMICIYDSTDFHLAECFREKNSIILDRNRPEIPGFISIMWNLYCTAYYSSHCVSRKTQLYILRIPFLPYFMDGRETTPGKD